MKWEIHPSPMDNIIINNFIWWHNLIWYDVLCRQFDNIVFFWLSNHQIIPHELYAILIGLLIPTSTGWQKEVYPPGVCWTSTSSFCISLTTLLSAEHVVIIRIKICDQPYIWWSCLQVWLQHLIHPQQHQYPYPSTYCLGSHTMVFFVCAKFFATFPDLLPLKNNNER